MPDSNEKILLSIKEASDRYGIGSHRLRAIMKEDYECRYHLMIGRVIKIKKENFDKYVSEAEEL